MNISSILHNSVTSILRHFCRTDRCICEGFGGLGGRKDSLEASCSSVILRVVDVICIADDVANIAEDIFESISLTTTGEFVGEREEEEDSPLEEEAFGRASKEDCGDDVAVEVVEMLMSLTFHPPLRLLTDRLVFLLPVS